MDPRDEMEVLSPLELKARTRGSVIPEKNGTATLPIRFLGGGGAG